MQIKAKLVVLLVALVTASLMTPPTSAAPASPEVDRLVNGFPTLDELETHMGFAAAPEGADNRPLSVHANSEGREGSIYPVSLRWYTAPPPPNPFSASAGSNAGSGENSLASLLAKMDAAQREAGAIGKNISRENNLSINKYLFDRINVYARTDYGTDITGLFVNGGIGFGTVQQTLRQNYGATYNLPLLQRYSRSSKWTRVLSGWTISSSIGALPQLNQALGLQQLLNNLQLSWSVSLSYTVSGSTLRKIQDGQYEQDVAFGKAAGRAAAAREELLQKMALRIDALSMNRPMSDTRLTSLRELYPQFELYQTRYEQATSCDEQMEDFFTLKGLALSLLTLAGYDRAENTGSNLLHMWKKARFAGCGRTT